MRMVLVHWMSEVCMGFRLGDVNFHLAVSLLDQLLMLGLDSDEWMNQQKQSKDSHVSDEENRPFFLIQRGDFQAVGWYVHQQN